MEVGFIGLGMMAAGKASPEEGIDAPGSGELAIWVGGGKTVFDKYHSAPSAMGGQALYIGSIDASRSPN